MSQKSLQIVPVPSSSLVCVQWIGGGEVPHELNGSYTTPMAAKMAIATWEAKNKRNVEVEVKRPDEEVQSKQRGRPKAINE